MTGKTHKAFGVATGFAVMFIPQVRDFFIANTNNVNEAVTAGVLFEAGCYLGSLASDGDNKDSTAGWWLYPFLRKFYHKDRNKLAIMFWHRHMFHSVWSVLFFLTIGVVLYQFTPFILSATFLGFALGMASHVLSDWIMSKVYLLSPFSEKGFSLLHLEGEQHEKARKTCDKVFYCLSLLADVLLVTGGVLIW